MMITMPQELLDEKFVGRPETEAYEIAEAQGVRARTRRRDGRGLVGTRDVRSDRLNFYVENDIVTKVYVQ